MTDEQIRDLRDEASAACDYEQVAICDVALDQVVYPTRWAHVNRLLPPVARAECARVIEDAKAQR